MNDKVKSLFQAGDYKACVSYALSKRADAVRATAKAREMLDTAEADFEASNNRLVAAYVLEPENKFTFELADRPTSRTGVLYRIRELPFHFYDIMPATSSPVMTSKLGLTGHLPLSVVEAMEDLSGKTIAELVMQQKPARPVRDGGKPAAAAPAPAG